MEGFVICIDGDEVDVLLLQAVGQYIDQVDEVHGAV